ncbi:MAG: hypothetical protein Q9218_005265 [Villophora microphyllina]
MTDQMRANGKGPASALYITTIPIPRPKATDALVRIKAFGLNRMDLLQREGRYPVPPQAPTTLGVEFSGVIESFGSDDARGTGEEAFKVGDEVFGLAYGGAYAEFIAVSTKMLMHKPKELSWDEAAGIPEQPKQCTSLAPSHPANPSSGTPAPPPSPSPASSSQNKTTPPPST